MNVRERPSRLFKHHFSRRGPRGRTRILVESTLLAAACATFFALALSGEAYAVTSPSIFHHYVALHKAYTLVAFAIVGYLVARLAGARRATLVGSVAAAGFSFAIELAQAATGGHESMRWHAADVTIGALGGFAGGYAARLRAGDRGARQSLGVKSSATELMQ